MEKARERIFPSSIQKEHSSANILILHQWTPFQTSDIQNCKFKNFHSLSHLICIASQPFG